MSAEAAAPTAEPVSPVSAPLTVAVILFENFELLDVGTQCLGVAPMASAPRHRCAQVAAPCELLGASAKTFKLIYASPVEKVITSSCMGVSTGQPGPQIVPTRASRVWSFRLESARG